MKHDENGEQKVPRETIIVFLSKMSNRITEEYSTDAYIEKRGGDDDDGF
jgi:hypothetical protein